MLDRQWWTRPRLVGAGAAAVLLVGSGIGWSVASSSGSASDPGSATAALSAAATPSAVASSPAALASPSASPSPSVSTLPEGEWLSGVWVGGTPSPQRVASFGAWRGRPADTVVTYPSYGTWDELRTSDWNVAVFDGFAGRLVYGLPILPSRDAGSLQDVAAGKHDDVFVAVAATLRSHDRTDPFIRIGLEANGDWFPWGAGRAGNSPAAFVAAFRHVSQLLRRELPAATIVFDISCGHAMNDQKNRLDGLTKVYPGDDAVDVIGCDVYDQYTNISRSAADFTRAANPDNAVGVQDVVDFARAHGKKWAVPEWSIVGEAQHGGGDNPLFIKQMYAFFKANAADLAFEDYFNEAHDTLLSSIWENVQHPKSAAVYRSLWGPMD